MNHLSEDVVIMIFEYLDNNSMLNVMIASTYFANIFSSSSKLLLKYILFINHQNIRQYSENRSILNIPFKNVTLSNISCDELPEFVKKFESIEILKLQNITFNGFYFLSHLPRLSSLHVEKCSISNSEIASVTSIPTLKSITFDECRGNLFRYFKNQKSVDKVGICRHQWTSHGFSHADFNEMVAALPNLSHIVMDGIGTAGYFDSGLIPFKIRKLEAYLMTFSWTQTVPRLDFLKSQQGYLKELTIHKLPYDYDGGEVLKFIIEKMGLEKFYFRETPLILGGRKQEVKEFIALEVNITATFEMFRQFPTIESFSLLLTRTGLDHQSIVDVVNPHTDIFQNLKNLEILDHSGFFKNALKFIGFYKNCRNITRLKIRSFTMIVNDILSECLSYFPNLNEIHLNAKTECSKGVLNTIKNLTPNLKKLTLLKEVAKDAKLMFGSDVEIVEM